MKIKLFPEDYFIFDYVLIKTVTTRKKKVRLQKKMLNIAFKKKYMAVNVE